MKKLIKLALSGLTLLSGLITRNYDPVLEAYAASVAIPESTIIPNTLIESLTEESFNILPEATIEKFDQTNIVNNSYEHLNYNTLGSAGYLYAFEEDIYDLITSMAYGSGLQDDLIKSNPISYLSTDEVVYPYIGADEHYLHYYAFYKSVKTNFHFVRDEKNTNQRIAFYIDFFDHVYASAMDEFNDYIDLNTTIPVITINNEYPLLSIKLNGKGNSFKFVTHNYSTIERTKISSLALETGRAAPYKITIPYIENIYEIKVLEIGSTCVIDSSSLTDNYLYNKTVRFQFDESMKNYYRAYPFDIVSFSAADGYIAVNNNFSLKYKNLDSSSTQAHLISMNVLYTHTVKTAKTKNYKIGDLFPDLPGFSNLNEVEISVIDGNTIISEEITEEIHVSFSIDERIIDDNLTYWYFGEQLSIDEYSSGSLKILNIEWQLYDLENESSYNFFATNHYEDVNIHKYSFNASKAIRTFNFEMSGYMRSWSSKDANWIAYIVPILGVVYETLINYQCYGFSFYFDKSRTMPINNIQKVVVKYQCGYAEPNTENDGWYPNTEDEKKRVITRTMTLAQDRFLLGCALDDYGMVLTNSANKVMATDDYGNKFDYVIYKEHKVNDINSYISKMNPLEIYYETEEQEMVRMVGNSKGLHVVLDEDGEYRVYTSDGSLAEDYGVHESEDGTKLPAKDLNEDGIYDSFEVVDSDLGVVLQEMDPYEPPWWSTDAAKTGFTIDAVVALIAILIVIYAILKPRDFAFICKAIGQGFKNLFKSNKKSSSKKKKKTKTKKKSKGKK